MKNKNIYFSRGFRGGIEAGRDEGAELCDKALDSQLEDIIKKLDILMDKKHAKELGDNLEIMYGQRQCLICGNNPEKQREVILSEVKGETK